MLKYKVKVVLKERLAELEMNLANNYKDAAHAALDSYIKTLEQLHNDGQINDKDYNKYHKIYLNYKENMADYHH